MRRTLAGFAAAAVVLSPLPAVAVPNDNDSSATISPATQDFRLDLAFAGEATRIEWLQGGTVYFDFGGATPRIFLWGQMPSPSGLNVWQYAAGGRSFEDVRFGPAFGDSNKVMISVGAVVSRESWGIWDRRTRQVTREGKAALANAAIWLDHYILAPPSKFADWQTNNVPEISDLDAMRNFVVEGPWTPGTAVSTLLEGVTAGEVSAVGGAGDIITYQGPDWWVVVDGRGFVQSLGGEKLGAGPGSFTYSLTGINTYVPIPLPTAIRTPRQVQQVLAISLKKKIRIQTRSMASSLRASVSEPTARALRLDAPMFFPSKWYRMRNVPGGVCAISRSQLSDYRMSVTVTGSGNIRLGGGC